MMAGREEEDEKMGEKIGTETNLAQRPSSIMVEATADAALRQQPVGMLALLHVIDP